MELRGHDLREETAQCREITNELFSLRPDLVPYRIQLPAHDRVERTEVRVLDAEVIQIQLYRSSVSRHDSKRRNTHCSIRPLQLRKCRTHAHHNRAVYLQHHLRHGLVQLDHIRPSLFQTLLDIPVKSGIDVHSTRLELFHYGFKRGKAGGGVFGQVRESFEERGTFLFAV